MQSSLKRYLTILAICLWTSAEAQQLFDSVQVEQTLTTIPGTGDDSLNMDILKAIQIVDKKFRQISDTLYKWKSYKFTIIQPVLIETNDSVKVDPFSYGEELKLTSIVFNSSEIHQKVDSIAKGLNKEEKKKMIAYLERNFDQFSGKEKRFVSKAVRIKYIKFPDKNFVHVGIDIYGAHFLWTIDRNKDWEVVSVERLQVY